MHKIIVIFGPTASGKTALSIEIAEYISKKFDIKCEIISADSRQIYKGMNIGTSKVVKSIQKLYRHHFIDILSPTKQYSTSQFAKEAKTIINQIYSRGNVPIIAGGTGTFVMSLVGDEYLKNAEHSSLMLIPAFERQALYRKIEATVDKMFADGLYGEIKSIISNYHLVPKQLGKTDGYRQFIEYAKQNHKNVFRLNSVDLEKVKHRIKTDVKNYAMRQIGWLDKIEGYHIVHTTNQAKELVDSYLNEA